MDRSSLRRQSNILLVALLLLALAFGPAPSAASATPGDNPAGEEFAVQVVSSAPHQVTGGDARLHIVVPWTVPLHQVEVWVNGVDQRGHFGVLPGTRTLSGVIDGLVGLSIRCAEQPVDYEPRRLGPAQARRRCRPSCLGSDPSAPHAQTISASSRALTETAA